MTSVGALVRYFSLTFAVTWGFWFIAREFAFGAGTTAGARYPVWSTVFLYLGIFSPAFVAVAMTAYSGGRTAVRTLVARLFKADVAARWFFFAIGFIAAIKLTAALVHRATTGAWPVFGQTSVALLFAATVFSVVTGGQVGEELGWRGFALPRLAERLGLGGASITLGVVWALWHLPLFYFPGSHLVGQSLVFYTAQVTALSVAFTWLWWRAGGSLLLTMLLHAAVNNTKDIVPSAIIDPADAFALGGPRIAWITVVLLWVCAAYFLVQMRGRRVGEPAPAVPAS